MKISENNIHQTVSAFLDSSSGVTHLFETYSTQQFLPQGSSLAKTFGKWLIIAWLKTASRTGHLA